MKRKKSTPKCISERELSELKQKQTECFETIALHDEIDNDGKAESAALLSNWLNDTKLWQYNDLLQSLKRGMTPKIVNFIKFRLQGQEENEPDDLSRINKPFDLLKYLEKKYNTFDNVVYLQGIFLACKAPKLYDRCVEYAKRRGEKIMYFEKRLLERDHTKVIYVINCPDLSKYSRTDLEKLREMVATLLSAEFDDIIVSGIKNGCVIVTFMIRNCLISKLRALYTPENRSMTCQRMFPLKFKVLKVIVQDETIYPSEKSNAEEKPSEKVQDAPLNSSEEIERTVDNVDNILECNYNATSNVKVGNILECNDNTTSNVKVGNILECNDNAPSNVNVGNILECNDNTTSNLQKRDFTTELGTVENRWERTKDFFEELCCNLKDEQEKVEKRVREINFSSKEIPEIAEQKLGTVENRWERTKDFFEELCCNLKDEQEKVEKRVREINVSSKEIPEIAEQKLGTVENRWERTKDFFEELCCNLPKDEQEKVEKRVREINFSSKEIPEIAEQKLGTVENRWERTKDFFEELCCNLKDEQEKVEKRVREINFSSKEIPEIAEQKLGTVENRWERTKDFFEELCCNLPKDEQEKVEKRVREINFSSKEIPEIAEHSSAICLIQENQEFMPTNNLMDVWW
ncbi:probable DNA double-strand break repair Rad50 ATPase [Magallana gigas]|uniref:probable DNA double-strand break repair Rad50 ATPase n=1 Tax=Magallana gigas TaxID=29159 RepID=UPI0033413E25